MDWRETDSEETRKPQEFWLGKLAECTEMGNSVGENEWVRAGGKVWNADFEASMWTCIHVTLACLNPRNQRHYFVYSHYIEKEV